MVATMKSSDGGRHVPRAATDASGDDGDNADAAASHGHENENDDDEEEGGGGDSHTSSATAAADEELTLSTGTTLQQQLQQQQLGPGAYHVFPLGSAAAALTGDDFNSSSGRDGDGATTEVLVDGVEVAASAALAAAVDIADLPIMVTATVVDDSDGGYDDGDGGGEDSTEERTGRISSVSSVLVTHATPAPSDGDGSNTSDNAEGGGGGGGGGGEEAVLSLVDQRVVDHRMAQLEGAHRRTLRQHRTALHAGLLLLLAIAVVVAVSVPLTRSRGDASSTTEEACTRGIVELERRSPTDEGDDAEKSTGNSPVVGEPYEYYGMWSDVSGNTAVVGSPGTLGVGADGRSVRAGRVHVFRGRREDKTAVDDDPGDSPAWTWEEEATLEPNDRNTPWGVAASFGFRVALSGDVMAVASFTDDSGFPGVGMVYVYRRDAESNTWREEDVLVPPPDAEEDMFGALVAVSGSTVAVTSPLHGNSRGAVYVFERSVGEDGESAVWQEQAKLEASDGVEGDEFGSSLAIDGDTIVSGAVWAQNEAGDIGGKVYVFSKDKMGNWSETSILAAPDSKDNAEFGYAVAISNGTILVSAPFDVASTENDTNGAVYIYNHVAGDPDGNATWVETAKLSASDGPSGEEFYEFGGSIAIQDEIVAIGAPATTGGGGVYIYSLAGGGWTLMNKIQYPDTISLGRTIAMSETALVITDPLYNRNGMAQSGVAFAMDADLSTKETKC